MRRFSFIFFLTILLGSGVVYGQKNFDSILRTSLENAILLARVDYQLLDEEGKILEKKPGKNFTGRAFTFGIIEKYENVLFNHDFTKPWLQDENFEYNEDSQRLQISKVSVLRMHSDGEFEDSELNPNACTTMVENNAYSVFGAKREGLFVDNTFGKKKGFAVWLVSENPIEFDTEEIKLSLQINPMSITTDDENEMYDLSKQPTGNVLGGAFIIPVSKNLGSIQLHINGLFSKVNGTWKMASLGREWPD